MDVTADLVIRGGGLVTPDTVFAASVAIRGGAILTVGADAVMPEARETLDAAGLHVLTGAIETMAAVARLRPDARIRGCGPTRWGSRA